MTRTKQVAAVAVAALVAAALTAGSFEWNRERNQAQSTDQEIVEKVIEKMRADRAAEERHRVYDDELRRQLLKEQLCWYRRQNYYDDMKSAFGDEWRRMAIHAPSCDWGDQNMEAHKGDQLAIPARP